MVEQIRIPKRSQRREILSKDDQIVYVFSGPASVSVDSVYDEDLDAMMETYHRKGDTYTGGKTHAKCRCGCSHT